MMHSITAPMIVNDEVRKCVAFLAIQDANNGEFIFKGSGFFLGRELKDDPTKASAVHFVTARHVIDRARNTGTLKIFIRVNQKGGDAAWVETELSQWQSHPTNASIDVAMLPFGIPENLDHIVVPLSMGATEGKLKEFQVGLGDEVFITGLFRHHRGNRRNIPIVRVGNISCLVEEKVVTKDYGEIDAYLIEARSIGGLSGSPVFLNLAGMRSVAGVTTLRSGPHFLLLGLIHGHYDVPISRVDANDLTPEAVNTGIATVVPFQHIEEVFSHMENRKSATA